MLLSFKQALERVRREERCAAFAFCPIEEALPRAVAAAPVGANLFVLVRCAIDDYCVHYVGGYFGTPLLVRERYGPEQAPKEARLASYRILKEFDETVLRGELRSIHIELQMRANAQ